MKSFILRLIKFYQRYLSLDTGIFTSVWPGAKICRFTPRCSQYTYEAIDHYGIITGLWLGVKRIVRCHPFNPGGYDPIK